MDTQLKTIPASVEEWAKTRPPFLDVRAAVEFAQGHLPGAINIPILNDAERAEVGTCYKVHGQNAAIELGHRLVSGPVKEQRVSQWIELLKKNPQTVLYCFRGGLRSKIAQTWIREAGIEVIRVEGGYKESRSRLLKALNQIVQERNFLLISGPTGSGKTQLLKEVSAYFPSLDLEERAQHRGSAFGKLQTPQPAQAVFENQIIFDGLEQCHHYPEEMMPLILEDESRLIGRCVIPDDMFHKMRASPVVWVESEFSDRVEQIYRDYILSSALGTSDLEERGFLVFEAFKKSLRDIQKRLGGARTSEVMKQIQDSESRWLKALRSGKEKDLDSNRDWIASLLKYYYDPLYLGSLERRNPKIHFRGSAKEVVDFLLDEKKKSRATPIRTKAPTV